MISTLKIKNFQSHKRENINFSSGVNVIFGQSDKGKTALIRALRWTMYNKPNGDDIRSNWGGDTEVEVTFADGNTILRKRTNSENSYTLNNEKLKAFGQGVPQEVVKTINMDDVNIQQQLDAHFLLSETSGEVAIHFNKIAGISIIDKSIGKAKKAVADTKSSIAIHEADYVDKLEQHKRYETLTSVEKMLKNIERKEDKKKELHFDTTVIKTKVGRLNIIKEEFEEINQTLALEPQVQEILKKDKLWIENNVAVKKLRLLVIKLKECDKKITYADAIVVHEQTVKTLIQKQNDVSVMKHNLSSLKSLVSKHITQSKILAGNAGKLAELISKLASVNICPTCKQKVNFSIK